MLSLISLFKSYFGSKHSVSVNIQRWLSPQKHKHVMCAITKIAFNLEPKFSTIQQGAVEFTVAHSKCGIVQSNSFSKYNTGLKSLTYIVQYYNEDIRTMTLTHMSSWQAISSMVGSNFCPLPVGVEKSSYSLI